MSVIKMEQISKIYNQGKENECYALKKVSIDVKEGEWIAVIGKSGSGKSTFLQIAGLADKYTEGELFFEGESMNKKNQRYLARLRRNRISFILQDFGLIWHMSAFDNIAIPLYMNHIKAVERKKQVVDIAEQFGITDLLSKKINQLSGGQCQRVAIARAMVKHPAVLFADEPTGALDQNTARQVVDILEKVNRQRTTIVMVTHDMDIAKRCKRNIIIEDGKILSETSNIL